MEGIFGK
jgi:hypothetical protein